MSEHSAIMPQKKRPKKAISRRRKILRAVAYALIFALVFLFIALVVLWFNRLLVIEEGIKRVLKSRGYDSAFILENVTDTQASLRDLTLSHDGVTFFKADHLALTYDWNNLAKGQFYSIKLDAPILDVAINERGAVISPWMPQGGGGEFIFPKDGMTARKVQVNLATPYGPLDLRGTVFAQSLEAFSADISLAPFVLSGEREGQSWNASGESVIDVTREGQRLMFKDSVVEFETLSAGSATGENAFAAIDGAVTLPQDLKLGEYVYDGTATLSLGGAQFAQAGRAPSALSGIAAQINGRISGANIVASPSSPLRFNGKASLEAARAEYFGAGGDPFALSELSAQFEGGLSGRDLITQDSAPLRYNHEGKTRLSFDSLSGPKLVLGQTKAELDGSLSNSGQTPAADVTLNLDTQKIRLTDRAQITALARRVTLADTLSATPVADQFAASFTDQVQRLLSGAKTSLRANITQDGRDKTLTLSAPLTLTSTARPAERIRLTGAKQPFMRYDAQRDRLTMRGDLAINGARDLTFKGLTLTGPSENGWLWSVVSGMSGNISSSAPWQIGGASLSPFTAQLSYGRRGDVRSLNLGTDLTYTGPLIGYDVQELAAKGDMTLMSDDNGLALNFDSQAPVTAARIDTPLGWDAQNVRLTLPAPDAEAPLLMRKDGGNVITLSPSALSVTLIREDRAQDMTITSDAAQILGRVNGDIQDWSAQLNTARISSDTLPGPGSKLQSPKLTAQVTRRADNPLQISVEAQSANALVKPLTLRGVTLSASGTLDALDIGYSGGTAVMAGVPLPAVPVNGRARIENGVVVGEAKTALPQAPRFPAFVTYRYANGRAIADIDVPEFIFSPGGVQPQSLVPALRGKVAEVSGLASAKVAVEYIAGQPLQSRGTVTASNMDMGTLVGPFGGVNTTLTFDSLYPLRTSGVQTVTMDSFDPGLPLPAGEIDFAVIAGGIDIRRAQWPIKGGVISVRPSTWSTTSNQNRVIVEIKDVSLGDLIAQLGNEDLSATGQITGTLPIYVDGVTVKVDGGRLEIPDGGVISVRSKGLDEAGARNETADLAVQALKNFRYESLTLDINGPLDGAIKLGAVFTGSNPNVLYGSRFLFRTTIEGELVSIARSFAKDIDYQRYLDLLESGSR